MSPEIVKRCPTTGAILTVNLCLISISLPTEVLFLFVFYQEWKFLLSVPHLLRM